MRGSHLEFDRIAEVKLKGFRESTEIFIARVAEEAIARVMRERVAADGLLAPGRAVVVLLSGGRDSTCLLDLAVSIAGAGAVTALHVNYGLREAARDDERHCAGVVRAVRRPARGAPAAAAASPGTSRRGRATSATGRRRRWRSSSTATSPPATPRPTRWRRSSTGSRRRRAAGRCWGCAPREGRLVRPLLPFTREETAAYCRDRGLEWREDETNESDVYARGRVRHALVPALRAIHPAAQQNVLALAEILRGRGGGARRAR